MSSFRALAPRVAAAMMALTAVGDVASAQSPSLRAKAAGDAGTIAAAVASRGQVRIIVEHVSAPTEAALSRGAGGLDGARRTIAEGRAAFLASLGANEAARSARLNVRGMAHMPLVALTVDSADLERLAGDRHVVRIWEDTEVFPSLGESVAVIGGPPASGDPSASPVGDGRGTTVVVIDTGVDGAHRFLAGKVVNEACFSTPERVGDREVRSSLCPNGAASQTGEGAGRPCPQDLAGCDHGTHVAGIVAGRRTSGDGPPGGVAPGASIVAIQVFSRRNEGCGQAARCITASFSDIVGGLDHVLSLVGRTRDPIVAINMSLGGGRSNQPCASNPVATAINGLRTAGILTVVASGNDGFTDSISSPACTPGAVSVGSTTKADQVSSFSNIAPFVTVLAPGTAIVSATWGNGLVAKNGTSMAAPHVAGAIALIRARMPNARPDDIVAALRETGIQIRDGRPQGATTVPRIRVDRALARLSAPPAAVATTPAPAAASVPPTGTAQPAATPAPCIDAAASAQSALTGPSRDTGEPCK